MKCLSCCGLIAQRSLVCSWKSLVTHCAAFLWECWHEQQWKAPWGGGIETSLGNPRWVPSGLERWGSFGSFETLKIYLGVCVCVLPTPLYLCGDQSTVYGSSFFPSRGETRIMLQLSDCGKPLFTFICWVVPLARVFFFLNQGLMHSRLASDSINSCS